MLSPKCCSISLEAFFEGSDMRLHPYSYDNELFPSSLNEKTTDISVRHETAVM